MRIQGHARRRGQASRDLLIVLAVAALACIVLLLLAGLRTPTIMAAGGG